MTTPVRQDTGARSASGHVRTAPVPEAVAVGLAAAILAVRADEPMVAVRPGTDGARPAEDALPCGLFSPSQHDSLEAGLRNWVQRQAGVELGAVRQICTFASQDGRAASNHPVVAVSYLGLVSPDGCSQAGPAGWRRWYAYFPWEDWRHGKPDCLAQHIEPRLAAWARISPAHCEAQVPGEAPDRSERVRLCFGLGGVAWDGEKTLERYELLCEAGLIAAVDTGAEPPNAWARALPRLRDPILGDQARVLASAVGELRRSIKCSPAIFELMPETFTLFELQKTVEAILGPHLHKQNFRRLVESGGLVEPTDAHRLRTGGRPARLYRFRRGVLLERLAPGVRVKGSRA